MVHFVCRKCGWLHSLGDRSPARETFDAAEDDAVVGECGCSLDGPTDALLPYRKEECLWEDDGPK